MFKAIADLPLSLCNNEKLHALVLELDKNRLVLT